MATAPEEIPEATLAIPISQPEDKKERGSMGKAKRKSKPLNDESEETRERTDFLETFGLNKSELIFQKWLVKCFGTNIKGFLKDGKVNKQLLIDASNVYLTEDQLTMLELYFNFCNFARQATGNSDIKKKWRMELTINNCKSPFELASVIYQKIKDKSSIAEQEEDFRNISSGARIDSYIKGTKPG